MHQSCKKCHRIQRLGFSVADYIWNIIPEGYRNKALCIECFLKLLDESIDAPLILDMRHFRWLGIVGLRIGGTLIDEDGRD